MNWLDKLTESGSRKVAQRSSRRALLGSLGTLLVGAAALPLLPVARTGAAEALSGNSKDPTSCDYWRYCAIDGFLCSCCGGSQNECPPGTEMSPITWIGTCRNPSDGKNYIISYHDCCGKSSCGACMCTRSEGDRPMYRLWTNNDINWCLGTKSAIYHCSTAIIVGTVPDKS